MYINLITALVSTFLGVLGVVVTIMIVKRSKPLFGFRSARLGGVRHPEISVTFANKVVQNLQSVRFVLWNSGKKEIRREDIPSSGNRPKIIAGDTVEILKYVAVSSNGDESAKFEQVDNELNIDFEYLNDGDAFLGEIFLTTESGNSPEIRFEGSLKGSKVVKGELFNLTKFDNWFFIATFLLFLLFAILSLYAVYYSVVTQKIGLFTPFMFFLVFSFMTYFDFKFNVLTIPNKIPKQYLHYLETGEQVGISS